MSAGQAKPSPTDCRCCGNGDSTLEHEWQLDRLSILQWHGGKDGIPSVACQRAVPHGRSVPETQSEFAGSFDDVFLRAKLGNENPTGPTCRGRRYARVTAVGLLDQHHQRQIRIGAMAGEVSSKDPRDQLA